MAGRQRTPDTRVYARSLTMAIREGVPVDLIVEFHLTILDGKTPVLKRDGRTSSGWKVEPAPGGFTPSFADIRASLRFLAEYGWGQPVQSIQLDAEVRGQVAQLSASVDLTPLGSADPTAVLALRDAVQRALAPPKSPEDVEDAELVEPVTTPADTSDPQD